MRKIAVSVEKNSAGFVWIADREKDRIRGQAVPTMAGARRSFGNFAWQTKIPRCNYTYGYKSDGVPVLQMELHI